MSTGEHPSGKPSGRTITIHLTNDTLMLIGALFFLILAISLVFIFPSSSTTDRAASRATAAPAIAPTPPIQPSATSSAQAAQAEAPSYPAPQAASVSANSAASAAAPSAAASPYPAPAAATGADPLIFNPARQPTEMPEFMAVSPDTIRSPTLPASAPISVAAPPATDAKIKPQAAPKPAAAVADAARPPAQQAAPPPPKPQPITILRESQHWSRSVRLGNSYRVPANVTLTIDAGVEVQLTPGASLIVDGSLLSLGTPDRPVRLVAATGTFWESIVGRPGSNISLEYTEIQKGGGGGTLINSDSGTLVIRNGRIIGNGGHIVAANSRVNIQNTTISDNEMPYGPALEVNFTGSGSGHNELILEGNRIIHNHLSPGTMPVQVKNDRPVNSSVVLELHHNLLIGQDGPDLALIANALLQGNITCNALVGGANGLSVHSNQPQTFYTMLNISDNAIEQHIPALDPFYRENHIGRGASSEIPLKMDANWWGNPLGPYAPDRHADGRGDAVGANISFDAWQTARPGCAPSP